MAELCRWPEFLEKHAQVGHQYFCCGIAMKTVVYFHLNMAYVLRAKASHRQQETVGRLNTHRECRETLASAASLRQQHAQHHLLSPSSMPGDCEACARRGGRRKQYVGIKRGEMRSAYGLPNTQNPAQSPALLVSRCSSVLHQHPPTTVWVAGARVAPVPRKSDPQSPYARSPVPPKPSSRRRGRQ